MCFIEVCLLGHHDFSFWLFDDFFSFLCLLLSGLVPVTLIVSYILFYSDKRECIVVDRMKKIRCVNQYKSFFFCAFPFGDTDHKFEIKRDQLFCVLERISLN